eukprot:m.1177 g.1177  ORF g.1177 m.1177 type:complete len:56 (-) comp1089_c0_seq2:96-263(-)
MAWFNLLRHLVSIAIAITQQQQQLYLGGETSFELGDSSSGIVLGRNLDHLFPLKH